MWKVYFFLYSLLIISGSVAELFQHTPTGILAIPDILVSLLSCIPVFSYVFNKKIMKKSIWQKFWWLSIFFLVIETLSEHTSNTFIHFLYKSEYQGKLSVALIIFGYILTAPMLYSLYKLSFKEWKDKEKEKRNVSRKPFSELAIASLVIGIAGIFLPVLLTLPACILGILALERIAKNRVRGKGMAWFGIGMFLFQVSLMSVFFGYVLITTFTSSSQTAPKVEKQSNKNAIEKMSKEELHFKQNNLDKINADSTVQDAAILLGEPNAVINLKENGMLYMYSCVDVPQDEDCTVQVTFSGNKAYKITWDYVGKFNYSKNLQKTVLTI